MNTRCQSLKVKALRIAIRLLIVLLLLAVLQVSSHAGSPATAASDLSGVSQEHNAPAQVQGDETQGPELKASAVQHLFWHEAVGGPAFLDAKSVDAVDLGLSEPGFRTLKTE